MGPRRFLACSAPALCLLALSLLAPAAPPAPSAQEKSLVRCDALVGFNGTAREGRFAPVILSVENPGARMKARISLTVTWGSLRGVPPGWTITREAVLDAGSTRRFPFVIPLPRDVRALQAAVTSQGTEVGSLHAELRPLATASRIVAGISSDLSLDSISALGGSAGSLRVVYPRVDDLPQAWAGYDGVDAVIVHDTYFQQLRADQVDALERWVVTGGVLVFSGGAAAMQHEPAGLGRLLPVRITGLTQRSGIAVAVGGGSLRWMPGRLQLAESRLVQGTVLAADGDLPLMVRHRLGRGSVWFLAFDPTAGSAAAWDGSLSMWRNILDSDRVPALGAADLSVPMEDPWIAALFAASPASFPSVPAILVFIGAYLALLVPLLVGPPGRGMKARARLLLLVVVCVCAGLAGWAVFNRLLFHPGLQTIDAARVEARSGDGLAFVTEKTAAFSASARDVEVRLGSSDPVLEAAGWRARPDLPLSEPHLFLTQAGTRTLVRGIDVPRLAARLVVFQDVVRFDVSVRVRAAGSGLEASVSNGNGKPLRGCYILVSGRAYPLGDVAAGASVQRTFAASDGLANPPGTSARSAADGAMFQDADSRRAAIFKILDEGAGQGAGPTRLVGWMDGPALAISFAGARPTGNRPGLTLVSVEAQ